LAWILSSALLALLAVASFVGSRIARRRNRQFDEMLIELAARRLAAGLAEPIEEEFASTDEAREVSEESMQSTIEDIEAVSTASENEASAESSESNEESAEVTGEGEPKSDESPSEGRAPARP
jgi:hypothetical protein